MTRSPPIGFACKATTLASELQNWAFEVAVARVGAIGALSSRLRIDRRVKLNDGGKFHRGNADHGYDVETGDSLPRERARSPSLIDQCLEWMTLAIAVRVGRAGGAAVWIVVYCA